MLATKGQILINIILFLLAIIISSPKAIRGNKSGIYFFTFVIAFFFCVFSFWGGDYFHYYSAYGNGFVDTHVEKFYTILADISPSYSIWRVMIWGTALLMIDYVFKGLKINKYYLVYAFVALCLLDFSYGRFSLSVAILVLGYSFLAKRKNLLLGLALLFLSVFIHRSAVFGIFTALLTLITPISKIKFFVLYSISFGVLLYFFNDALAYLIGLDTDSDEFLGAIASRGQRYLEKEEMISGFGGYLRDVLDKIPLYLSLILYFIIMVKKTISTMPKNIVYYGSWSALMILLASLFAFGSDFQTSVMYERFLQYSVLPLAIFLTFCRCNNIFPRFVKFIMISAIVSSLYTLLYAHHCAS